MKDSVLFWFDLAGLILALGFAGGLAVTCFLDDIDLVDGLVRFGAALGWLHASDMGVQSMRRRLARMKEQL